MERLTRLSLEYPKTTLAVILAVTVVLGAGLPRVRPEFGYRVLIGDDHPAIRQLDGFIEKFGGGLPIRIAWECGVGFPCKNVFDAASMRVSKEISERLLSTPGVGRVTAPSSAPLLVAHENGFMGCPAGDLDGAALHGRFHRGRGRGLGFGRTLSLAGGKCGEDEGREGDNVSIPSAELHMVRLSRLRLAMAPAMEIGMSSMYASHRRRSR